PKREQLTRRVVGQQDPLLVIRRHQAVAHARDDRAKLRLPGVGLVHQFGEGPGDVVEDLVVGVTAQGGAALQGGGDRLQKQSRDFFGSSPRRLTQQYRRDEPGDDERDDGGPDQRARVAGEGGVVPQRPRRRRRHRN